MSPAEAGGGGGGGSLAVDHGTLRAVSTGLESAATSLDGVGSSIPSAGATGEAAALLNLVLARFSETGSRIAFESATLGTVVEECNTATQTVDRAQAEAYLTGVPDGGS